jgi:hypothetical protein
LTPTIYRFDKSTEATTSLTAGVGWVTDEQHMMQRSAPYGAEVIGNTPLQQAPAPEMAMAE